MASQAVPGEVFIAISGATASSQHFLPDFEPKIDEQSMFFSLHFCDATRVFFKPANLENCRFTVVKLTFSRIHVFFVSRIFCKKHEKITSKTDRRKTSSKSGSRAPFWDPKSKKIEAGATPNPENCRKK